MLQIDIDTKDVNITSPGLALIDPVSSFRRVLAVEGETSAYFVPPTDSALMLRPLQLMPSWPSATKFRGGDYGGADGWQEQAIRSPSDWFMHSSGPVTVLSLSYVFPANTGWFVEFRAYALPKSLPIPIFDFSFGHYFQIVVNSDGRMDLYDQRQGCAAPIASGNIANFNSFTNQDVQLLVLPYRRQQILIWSPNRGGYIDATVTVSKDGNITEPGVAAVYSVISPSAALVAITPLLYPADGVSSIAIPPKPLPNALTQTPSLTASEFDEPGNSRCVLTPVTTYTSSPGAKSFVYSAAMAGNTLHQSAEAQGVAGISTATADSSGDSVFAGSSYPYSLYSPFLYLTVITYPRTLGPTSYSTTTLSGVLSAKLKISRDRASKSLTFVVDNPANVTGVGLNYTSLKDLQNRRCKAYLTNATLELGGTDAAIASDPDPDTPLIVSYGYSRVYLFDGFTDQPEFVDGVGSQIIIRCQGLRKRLRSYIFCDQPYYDGQQITNVITDILTRCGFIGPSDSIAGMGVEIVCESSSDVLPAAIAGAEPLFTPAIGATAEEFLSQICSYTGWILDDLIAAGESNSAWYWTSRGYYASSVFAAQGSPNVSRVSTYLSGLLADSVPIPDAVLPNQGIGKLVMISEPPPKQSLEELIANEIFVFGTDDRGQLIAASARDEGSITNASATNYVGETRSYLLIAHWINTQLIANQVCALLFGSLTQARTHLTFALPDYYPQLGISAPLTLSGYWDGAIDSIEADLSSLRTRRTILSVLRSI